MAVAKVLEFEPGRSARQQIRDFLEQLLDNSDDFSLAEIIIAAQKQFAHDEAFLRALYAEALPLLVNDELQQMLKQRRQDGSSGHRVSAEMVELRAKEIAARIFEVTANGRRKSLLAMRKPELLFAAGEREKQANGLMRYAKLERTLARQMKTNEVTVGEAFTDSQFERIWEKHFADENTSD